MRVSKTDVIAGLPAGQARAICRKFRGRQIVAEIADDLLKGTGFELDAVFTDLEAAGYLEKIRTDNHRDVWWDTTLLVLLYHLAGGTWQTLRVAPLRPALLSR